MTLNDLYDEFERELLRYGTALTHNTDWAGDLVQETFIRAIGHLALLGQLNRYQQSAWLRRTLKNLFLDEVRSQQRQEALLARVTEPDDEIGARNGPSIREIFEIVPERYRALLHQRYVLGMTGEEIARDLGIPAATVRSRLHLAIQWLRTHQDRLQ